MLKQVDNLKKLDLIDSFQQNVINWHLVLHNLLDLAIKRERQDYSLYVFLPKYSPLSSTKPFFYKFCEEFNQLPRKFLFCCTRKNQRSYDFN
ncbi:MAG: hypothetical protein RCG15_00455 [Candidatus Rickettsia vulgarisii]